MEIGHEHDEETVSEFNYVFISVFADRHRRQKNTKYSFAIVDQVQYPTATSEVNHVIGYSANKPKAILKKSSENIFSPGNE